MLSEGLHPWWLMPIYMFYDITIIYTYWLFSSTSKLRFRVLTNLTFNQVGLNNIKETDFVNVTIQSLMRVTPLRNFFLIPQNYHHSKSPLVHRFGELTRKIWHARNFKGQVCFWIAHFFMPLLWWVAVAAVLLVGFFLFRSVPMNFSRQLWKLVTSDSK